MSEVYILGADLIRFGRFPERSIADLGAEATLLALDDAELSIKDINAMYCGTVFQAAAMTGQAVLREVGQTGIPVVNVSNACATGAATVREGWLAIRSGLYDLVLCLGVEKMPRGLLNPGGDGDGIQREGQVGSGLMPCLFAEAGMEHVRKHGTTFEQFAKVSVKNHHHSTLNPKAMYQVETPLEKVMNAEMIAYPNTKLMCSVNVDGAAAVILASEKKARQLGLSRAVRIRSSALASDPYTRRNLVHADWCTVTRKAAGEAYTMANAGPEDLNLVELHDCFATAEILHYENLGLCADGEAGRLIDRGDTELGGRIPVNVSGGLLSKGHPLGATGVANLCELTAQLRGEAERRQVEGARLGLAHVVGAGSACAVHILESAA